MGCGYRRNTRGESEPNVAVKRIYHEVHIEFPPESIQSSVRNIPTRDKTIFSFNIMHA